MREVRLKHRLALTRGHSVVCVHEKARKAGAEVTHVTIRNRAERFLHVIR